jgi:hypothetical protein
VYDYDSRHIYGLEGWVTEGQRRTPIGHKTGAIPLLVNGNPVGQTRWTLLDKDAGRSFAPFHGKGHVRARYRGELMPVPPINGYALQQLMPWGVIEPEVADRVRIIVELDQTGPGCHVRQDSSRARLRAADDSPIPWESFQDQFNTLGDTLAAPIWEAMDHARKARPRITEAERRLMTKLAAKLQIEIVPDVDVEVAVDDPGAPNTHTLTRETIDVGGGNGGGGANPDGPGPGGAIVQVAEPAADPASAATPARGPSVARWTCRRRSGSTPTAGPTTARTATASSPPCRRAMTPSSATTAATRSTCASWRGGRIGRPATAP